MKSRVDEYHFPRVLNWKVLHVFFFTDHWDQLLEDLGAIKCMRHFQSVPMTWVKNQISIFPGIINTCKFGFQVDLLLFHFFIFYFAFLLLLVSGQEKNVHVQKKKRVKVVLGIHFSLDITPIINKHLRQCFNLLFLCSKASKSFNRPATHPVKKKTVLY